MEYIVKLSELHQTTTSEGIIGDYAGFWAFKKIFGVPNMPFYKYREIHKEIIEMLRKKGFNPN